jgi:hypothetical protein
MARDVMERLIDHLTNHSNFTDDAITIDGTIQYSLDIKLINALITIKRVVSINELVKSLQNHPSFSSMECSNNTKFKVARYGVSISCLIDQVTGWVKLQIFGAKSMEAFEYAKTMIKVVLPTMKLKSSTPIEDDLGDLVLC